MNHKLNKKKVAFVMIIAVLVISLGVFLFNNVNQPTKKETPKKVQEKTVQKEEKKKEEAEVNFTISFAGDCTLGNYAGQAYDGSFNQEYKRQGNDPTYFLKKVKDVLEKEVTNDLKTSNTIETSRIIIEKNMDKYKNKVKETLEDLNYNTTFTINFGDNYFPKKEYKDVIYEEGKYESLVVTLGNGEGDNWWCVLFPPICTLEVEENKDIEYKFFVKEIFEKYLKR